MSLGAQLHQEHIERRLRIGSRAVIDRGINLRDRIKRPVIRKIEIREILTDKSQYLQAQLMSLEQQMIAAHAEIERLRNPPTYPQVIHRIIDLICAGESIPKKKLTGHRRFPDYVRARHLCYYLARQFSDRSYPQIGRCFSGRDHSTIWHGERKITALRRTDEALDAKLQWYEAQLSDK